MRLTRHSETVTIEGTADEIRALFGRARLALPDDVDPQSLTVSDARRYQYTGRVGDYGEREAIDVRTGKRGVEFQSMGIGFVAGATVDDSGRVRFAHPSDNPLQGCRW